MANDFDGLVEMAAGGVSVAVGAPRTAAMLEERACMGWIGKRAVVMGRGMRIRHMRTRVECGVGSVAASAAESGATATAAATDSRPHTSHAHAAVGAATAAIVLHLCRRAAQCERRAPCR